MPLPLTDLEKFEKWYAVPLLRLAQDPDAGFIMLMATFPILERYLKVKSGSVPVKPPFLKALIDVVPEIETKERAKTLWTTYRDQLLHNASYDKRSHWLSPDKKIIEHDEDGRDWLNPALFVQRVISVIRRDFSCFEAGLPLAEVSVFDSPSELPDGVHMTMVQLGTGTPPRRKK